MNRSLTLFVITLLLLLASDVFAQIAIVQVNRTTTNDAEEVTIAINPVNPMQMIAGANLRYRFYSSDGGTTWFEGELYGGTWGDPSVTYGPDGTAYMANLVYGWDAIIVRHSTNGGYSWSQPVKLFGPSSDSAKVGSFYESSLQDKEWLIVDHSQSPYRGNVYCSWTDFTKYGSEAPEDSSVIVFARSIDKGATFEPFVRVSDIAGDAIDSDSTMEGAVPAVGPDGEVYICWAGPDGLYFDRSFDGGATFGTDAIISDMPGGWDLDISGISRCNGMPVTLCDISDSPNRGTIYINWVDLRNGDPDVFIMKSTDRGDTWSEPIRVNNDPLGNGKDQFFTWATVDEVTGELSVVFYDRRAYYTDSTDVYLARSTDGGETYTNERLTPRPFYPAPFVFFGDYIGIDAYNGIIRPIWTEMHNTQLTVFTALIGEPLANDAPAFVPDAMEVHSLYPNPYTQGADADMTLSISLPLPGEVTIGMYDALGRLHHLQTRSFSSAGTHSLQIDGSDLERGIYFCKVSAVYGQGASTPGSVQSIRVVIM